ncbi:MAG: rhomboid family intramembrane serine protease [Dermatophilaceae bacterium]
MSLPPPGPPPSTGAYGPPTTTPVCPRHPDRISYVSCQRCGRPTCPECQVPAAVGVHCVDCVAAARRDRSPHLRRAQAASDPPYITYGFAALITVVYVAQLASPAVTNELALVPALGWSEPWRLVTNVLVHSPTFPLHLIGNAIMIVLLGRWVERALGHARYAALCLASTLGGSAAVVWANAPPTMGHASGWISAYLGASTIAYGLMTALIVLALAGHGDLRGLVTLLLINVVITVAVPNVSWQGHLGGGVAGALAMGGVVLLRRRGTRSGAPALPRTHASEWIWLVALVVGFAVASLARYAWVAPNWGGMS